MPQTDFKTETLGTQMRRVWRENKGNYLVATACLVSMLAWAVGYFQLLPEFNAVRRLNSSVVIGGKTLTVHIVGCDGDKGHVVAMLYDAPTFNEQSVPSRMEVLPIEDGEAQWTIHSLAYGKYAIYAFQDLDDNETVDPATERQGITITSKVVPLAGSNGFNFSSAAFEFSATETEVTVELR